MLVMERQYGLIKGFKLFTVKGQQNKCKHGLLAVLAIFFQFYSLTLFG